MYSEIIIYVKCGSCYTESKLVDQLHKPNTIPTISCDNPNSYLWAHIYVGLD